MSRFQALSPNIQLPPVHNHRFAAASWLGRLPRLAIGLVSLLVPGVLSAAVELRQTSVPVGLINQTSSYDLGALATTVTAPESSGSYSFAYWTLNGVRAPDASGGAANPVRFIMGAATDAVAIYLSTSQDTDSDGLPDWWEQRYFGTLSYGSGQSPDGDSFSNLDEYQRGQHPGLHNEHALGGVSRRRSLAFNVIQNRDAYCLVREKSDPAGVVDQTRVVSKGLPVQLATPPPATGGFRFSGWLRDGARFDRPLDFQPLTVTPTADLTLLARYTPEALDSDSDGVPDWREWLLFEALIHTYASDPDGDGFTWSEEDARGTSTLAANSLVTGGVSRRRSSLLFVDTTGRFPVRQNSVPATILDLIDYHVPGTNVTILDRAGSSSAGYTFAYYTRNGTRVEDTSGVARTGFSFSVSEATVVTGHYFDPQADTDNDGIKDIGEWATYGSLANGPTSDSDGDGFTYAEELARLQSPRVVDMLTPGGISRRRGSLLFVDTTGRLPYRLRSSPATILDQTEYHPRGTRITVADRVNTGLGGYTFVWWTLNGARQADASGTARTGFSFTLDEAADLVGHYMDPNIDTDADGILDRIEMSYYGSLAQGPNSDTDGDGFSFAAELSRAQSPQVWDDYVPGGISRRRSQLITINPIISPAAPELGSVFATNIGQSSVTLRALVNPMSVATTAHFAFGTTVAYGQTVASTSVLNGFIAEPMDGYVSGLQPDTLYHFRVTATNAQGTRTSQDVTFRTLPEYSGYRLLQVNFGLGSPEADDDNDGLANVLEYAFSLNPLDPDDAWMLPPPEWVPADRSFWLRYAKLPSVAEDVRISAQYSTDLVTWHELPNVATAALDHVFQSPASAFDSAKRVFIRWKVDYLR